MSTPDTETGSAGADPFPATRWTVVLRARGGSGDAASRALAEVCETYWFPIYAYARHSGCDVELAKDLTQGFFTHLLAKGMIDRADPAAGRLRAFLLAGFKKFRAGEFRRGAAEKRGGGAVPESLDVAGAESRYAGDLRDGDSPDRLFERRWAMEIIGRAIGALADGYARRGRAELFDAIKPHLEWGGDGTGYAAIGRATGLGEAAVAQEVRRMRQRFRQLLEDEIAGTVDDPAEIAQELRCLILALG